LGGRGFFPQPKGAPRVIKHRYFPQKKKRKSKKKISGLTDRDGAKEEKGNFEKEKLDSLLGGRKRTP